ncbi:MAG: hypothetical protein H8E81_07775 [Deltaproteobacteria bacterium]|nr:hypothetical protein [Deltaproteobacteria bacterium]
MDVKTTHPRLRAWGWLFFGFLCVGLFAFIVGPWFQNQIPTYQKIVQVIEERDIDAGAYFYSEIKASYEGEQYLLESLKLGAPDEVGLTLPFVFSIALCGVILWIGYRYLPMD